MKNGKAANDAAFEKFYSIIEGMVAKAVSRMAGVPKLGTVRSVSGSEARVVIDGDSSAVPAAVFCPGVSGGKRVLVTVKGTQYYVTGVRQ